jgi:hypothetical protein
MKRTAKNTIRVQGESHVQLACDSSSKLVMDKSKINWIAGVQGYRNFKATDQIAYEKQGQHQICAIRKLTFCKADKSVYGTDVASGIAAQGTWSIIGKLAKDKKSIQAGYFILNLADQKQVQTFTSESAFAKARFNGKGTVNVNNKGQLDINGDKSVNVKTFIFADCKKMQYGYFLFAGKILRNEFRGIGKDAARNSKFVHGLKVIA